MEEDGVEETKMSKKRGGKRKKVHPEVAGDDVSKGSKRKRKNKQVVKEEVQDHDKTKVFDVSEIKRLSYKHWKKEANALLPSAKVGLESQESATTTTARRKTGVDPRALSNIIKRLSIDEEDYQPMKSRKAIFQRRKSIKRLNETEVKTKYGISAVHEKFSDDDIVEDEKDRKTMDEMEKAIVGLDIQAKLDNLKVHAGHLSEKRKVRRQLLEEATEMNITGTKISGKLFKDHGVNVFLSLSNAIHYFMDYLMLWSRDIREINGRYGLVMASYFTWLRELLIIEVLSFIIVAGFIILPEFFEPGYTHDGANYRGTFGVLDILTGEDYLHDTHLYYNKYSTSPTTNKPWNVLHYSSFRFLLVIVIKFVIVTGVIFQKLSNYFHSTREDNHVSGVAKVNCFEAIICGWDWSCRDAHAKTCLHKIIARDLMLKSRSYGNQDAQYSMEASNNCCASCMIRLCGPKCGPWMVNILANLLIIIGIGFLIAVQVALCYLKYFYYLNCIEERDSGTFASSKVPYLCPNGQEENKTIIFILPSLFTSLTTVLFTKVIVYVGDLECYSKPDYKIYATMIRAGVFYWSNVVVMYWYWLVHKKELARAGFVAETIMGKELYRLVVIQGIIEVLFNLLVRAAYVLIRRKISKTFQAPVFRPEYAFINMFFLHSVSLIGFLFCPPLSALVAVRFLIDFYHQKIVLYYLSSPDTYSVHVSHIYRPFMLTFFIICYLTATFMSIYYTNETKPSQIAGPFIGANQDSYIHSISTEFEKIKWFVLFTSPQFWVLVIILLLALLYVTYKWAKAYEPVIKDLDQQILLERTDRDILLKAIYEIGNVTNEGAGDGDDRKGGDDSTDEETDRRIGELIQHCRRKSATVFIEEKGDANQGKKKRRSLYVAPNDQAHHIKHVNAMVKDIVEFRKHRNSLAQEGKPQAQ